MDIHGDALKRQIEEMERAETEQADRQLATALAEFERMDEIDSDLALAMAVAGSETEDESEQAEPPRPRSRNHRRDGMCPPEEIGVVIEGSVSQSRDRSRSRSRDRSEGRGLGVGVECGICLTEMTGEDKRKVIDCRSAHVFHDTCINRWLRMKRTCPVCRDHVGLP